MSHCYCVCTIYDYDKVILTASGHVFETERPFKLIENEGVFIIWYCMAEIMVKHHRHIDARIMKFNQQHQPKGLAVFTVYV